MPHKIIIGFILFLFSCSCTSSKKMGGTKQDSITQLKFLGEYDVPNAKQYKGTTVGGLSGIDYDASRDRYYLISDDRSAINPARFYTAKIYFTEKGIDSLQFLDVTTLKTSEGKAYPNSKQDPFHTPDPEAIRYNPLKDELVWSSEGERIINPVNNVLEDPAVTAIDRNGDYKESFVLPSNMHMHATENGPRQNSVFEGMSFDKDFRYLYVNVEEPIYEDGPKAGLNDSTAWIRIIKFDAAARKPVAEYAYQIEAVAHPPIMANGFKINGVSDILWAGNDRLIVVERSFSAGKLACTIRVFIADMKGATNIAETNSLQTQPAARAISKKLLLNMEGLGRYIDNIEGVTFGPNLANGHRTLIFVADDNFSPLEKTQFLLFEVIP